MSRSDRILLAAGGGALILAVAAAWMLVAPPDDAEPDAELGAILPTTPAGTGPTPVLDTPTVIVVDVAGAVARPGIRELPGGSRIGDAIAAAGGYASDADLEAATTQLNLAQPLTDGEQVRVPRVGEGVAAGGAGGGVAAPPGSAPSGGGGLVNLNTATPEQLEALP